MAYRGAGEGQVLLVHRHCINKNLYNETTP